MKKRIGILGGGQLAKMSTLAAYRLGLTVNILEKEKDSPAGKITPNEFIGWVDDKKLLKEFISKSDLITLENEFIDSQYLKWIEERGKEVVPSSRTISLIQDKLIQKHTFEKSGLPVPKFYDIKSYTNYSELSQKLGQTFLIKSRKFGYDGYGNRTIKNGIDFQEALQTLTARHTTLMAEEFVNFRKELAVMIVRTKKEIRTYPVVETIQKKHICHIVIAPAQIPEKVSQQIKELGIEAVKSINGYGIFGLEFFLTQDDKILINEIAPRPHNSGHYSIEGCITSQFENHIRSVLDLPLGSTEMVKPFAVMINLLGKVNKSTNEVNLNNVLMNEEIHLHIYGKNESRIGRKMGHITILGDNLEEVLKQAIKADSEIII